MSIYTTENLKFDEDVFIGLLGNLSNQKLTVASFPAAQNK